MLGDFGLFGLSLFLLPLITVIAYSAVRIVKTGRASPAGFAFVSLVGLLIQNMTGPFFYSPLISSLTLLVMILASLSLCEREPTQEKACSKVGNAHVLGTA